MESSAPRTQRRRQAMAAWRQWWKRQSPIHQDRLAILAPIFSVLLFLAAIVLAFTYLHLEEVARMEQSVHQDGEFSQQQLRIRLVEQQEQVLRMAREIAENNLDAEAFIAQAVSLVQRYAEIRSLHWLDVNQRVQVSYAAPTVSAHELKAVGSTLGGADLTPLLARARFTQLPQYQLPPRLESGQAVGLQMAVPLYRGSRWQGQLLVEYSLDQLYRAALTRELSQRYAVSLLDLQGHVLAGIPNPRPVSALLPWQKPNPEFTGAMAPVGEHLQLRLRAYRISHRVISDGLFWLIALLSVLTAWMLIGTWRHTRKRMQAQEDLLSETNFRRAMENSILTGMRALDMQGRMTYVNFAFCQMTGWSEAELVGSTAPFPYWPEEDYAQLNARLDDELHGRSAPGGFQVRVKRKNGVLFDARLYVSPLIDARGVQTGWMTSMTDITEPNRIREQLSASYERFTTVLEALDASVSVAPIGSDELLFANKLYRQWFGARTQGHLKLLAPNSRRDFDPAGSADDAVDALVGLPTDDLVNIQSENAEIYVAELDKWLEVRSRYLNWVDGRLAQMVIATDITARRQAQEQAAAQAERAQSASRLITMGEMASSVAHELNQPLTAISNYCTGMVKRIKNQQLSEADLLTTLEKTAHQAQRAGQIIQRIRSFVKRSEPNRCLASVEAIVEESVELAGIELRRRNVRLKHYVAARLPMVLVDPILIEQVLVNLLKNAAESVDLAERETVHRQAELRVLPRLLDGLQVLEFSVQDTGRGLAPEVMGRLFEAFFSTKAEGMGIGLNLCRSIVESHQGQMSAENIYNGGEISGCRFTFWLPLPGDALLPSDPAPFDTTHQPDSGVSA